LLLVRLLLSLLLLVVLPEYATPEKSTTSSRLLALLLILLLSKLAETSGWLCCWLSRLAEYRRFGCVVVVAYVKRSDIDETRRTTNSHPTPQMHQYSVVVVRTSPPWQAVAVAAGCYQTRHCHRMH
jgi:hypothetical protein